MLLLAAAGVYLQVKYNISAFGFSSALNSCLAILSSLLALPEWDHLPWSFVCLEWLHFPAKRSQEQPSPAPAVEGSSLPSSAGMLPGSSSAERGTHPVCAWSRRVASESGAPVVSEASMDKATEFTFPLGSGSWPGCSALSTGTKSLWHRAGRVNFQCDRSSNALSDNYSHHLLFLKYIYRFISKKSLTFWGDVHYKRAVICCVLINMAFLYSPGLLTALWWIWTA